MLECSQLLLRASNDIGVAMAASNDGYPRKKIRVPPVLVIVQVLHLPFDDLRRSLVKVTRARVKMLLPLLQDVIWSPVLRHFRFRSFLLTIEWDARIEH